jgi:hypothetical protein
MGRGRGIETNLASIAQDSMIPVKVKHDKIGRQRCARSEYSRNLPLTLQSLFSWLIGPSDGMMEHDREAALRALARKIDETERLKSELESSCASVSQVSYRLL